MPFSGDRPARGRPGGSDGKEAKVATASKVACVGMAVGVALGGAGLARATLIMTRTVASLRGQVPTGPSSAYAALNGGRDSYLRGDYESAALFLQQADAGKSHLAPAAKDELAHFIQLNTQALQSRRDGSAQIHQVEQALHDGKVVVAEGLCKGLSTNQFLAPADRVRARALAEQVRVAAAALREVAGSDENSPAMDARTKLHQARALMARGEYDLAEALSCAASQLNVEFNPGEDTPRRVMDDLTRARKDARGLLAASRLALGRGELDLAARLANEAQHASGVFTWRLFGDNPSKALKDIEVERKRVAVMNPHNALPANSKEGGAVTTESSKAIVTPVAPPANQPADKDGHLIEARAANPAALPATLPPASATSSATAPKNDDSAQPPSPPPVEVNAQGNAAQLRAQALAALEQCWSALNDDGANSAPSLNDPRRLLSQARRLLDLDKPEQAETVARYVKTVRPDGWGLFDDTPERVLHEARKAEARKLLARARRCYEEGKLSEARAEARRAEELHGPYSMWDLDSRPRALLGEIEAAELKQERNVAAAGVIARGAAPDDNPPALAYGPQVAVNPAAKARSQQLLAEVHALENRGRLIEARQKALEAQRICDLYGPNEDRPELALMRLSALAARQIEAYIQDATRCGSNARADAAMYDRADRDLLQARQLALSFGLDCQPVDAMIGWVRQARARAGLMPPSSYVAAPLPSPSFGPAQSSAAASPVATPTPPSAVRQVAMAPTPAPQSPPQPLPPAPPAGNLVPAAPMAQPSAPVVQAAYQQPQAPAPSRAVPVPQPSQAEVAYEIGMKLLNDARMELKQGATDNARRLAEAAFARPDPRIRDEATALLRSIAAEEYNQRALNARRSFEAGVSLYRRQEYAQALTVLQSIDATLLRPEQAARLRELMAQPELQPRTVLQAAAQMPAQGLIPSAPGKATASDVPAPAAPHEESYAQQVQAMQDIQFQELRDKGLKAQREATARAQAGDVDQALDILEQYLAELKETRLEQERVAMLRRPIENRYQQFRTLKAQQDLDGMRNAEMNKFADTHIRQVRAEEQKEKQVTELMHQYHDLYKQGKYAEAMVAAQKARELDPDNVQAGAAVKISEMARNRAEYKQIKSDKEEMFLRIENDAEREGPVVTTAEPLKYDKKRWEIAGHRKAEDIEVLQRKTEKEREIEQRLLSPTTIDFKDVPLRQILDDLSATNQMNIVTDQAALDDAGISVDRPMTMKLDGVQLKSALDLLLGQAHLTYVIKDEALCITTEAHAKGRLVQRVFGVGDLVIPLENHDHVENPVVKAVNDSLILHSKVAHGTAGNDMAERPALSNGTDVQGPSTGGSMMDKYTSPASTPPGSGSNTSVTYHNPDHTLEGVLMDLITNTIHPESWSKVGGPGTIDYYPLGMALVVNQTPDIQEQVAELLSALRRLTDLEVAMELRLISLDESFFERIGVDFSMNIVNNHQTKYFPQLSTQQFNLPLQNQAFTPSSFLSGLTPAGSFTGDLGIPIAPSSYNLGVPPYGNYNNSPGSDGGLSVGLAFLSDIQVYMLVEAAQGDIRSNVMTAPKITAFNGQTGSVAVSTLLFYVTDVTAVAFGGQVIFSPTPTALGNNLTIAVRPIVSADRRFVRMDLAVFLANPVQNPVDLFPITAFITPILDGGVAGPPVPFTQYLQFPTINTSAVLTSVSVPDGGTVVVGGLKTLYEGRNEFGPPILSEIPYLNRLFKNVGYGRETQSTLLMVTPRIVINEEEEIIQTGVESHGFGAARITP